MPILASIGYVLSMAFFMFWEILWALILGFLLSAIVQAVVSTSEMSRLLPDDSPKTVWSKNSVMLKTRDDFGFPRMGVKATLRGE
jgi:hypothetical protein